MCTHILTQRQGFGDLTRDENWNRLSETIARFVQRVGCPLEAVSIFERASERSIAAALNCGFEWMLKQSDKRVYFCKANRVDEYFATLLDSFPEAKFVVQVRDPRDFYLSYKTLEAGRWLQYEGFPAERVNSPTPLHTIKRWVREQTIYLNACADLPSSRVHLHRYEDLVSDPNGVTFQSLALSGLFRIASDSPPTHGLP